MPRKVIGMGESTMDIIFRGSRPQAAVPGGSCFNSCVSLGRAGIDVSFLGTTGNDRIGQDTARFLEQNGVRTDFYELSDDTRSSLSLAYLDDRNDADYLFYKYPPLAPRCSAFPSIGKDDVILLGSYYAVCDEVRSSVLDLLGQAGQCGAIVYYDINFRRSRLGELDRLLPRIRENARQSVIVRGSSDDFDVIFGIRDARTVYERHFRNLTDLFICTSGSENVTLCCRDKVYSYAVPQARTVSCVGAGDSFNAGLIYGIFHEGLTRESLVGLSEEGWNRLISYAMAFSLDVCQSEENYIGCGLAARCKKGTVLR